MTLRTTRTLVTFGEPFHLKAFPALLPPGDYEVEVDEEVIEGNEHTVYRRVATGLRVREGARTLTYPVDAEDLAKALEEDLRHHSPAPISADIPRDAPNPIAPIAPWRSISRWVQKLRSTLAI